RHTRQPVAHAIARIHAGTVGIHDLLVRTEAQQVVTQRPLEVQPRGLALVVAGADAGVARMAPFLDGRRAEDLVVGAVAADDAARAVPGAAAGGAALVHAIHRLGDEVLGEVAGVGQRPVV